MKDRRKFQSALCVWNVSTVVACKQVLIDAGLFGEKVATTRVPVNPSSLMIAGSCWRGSCE
jgi:hypothetical protein